MNQETPQSRETQSRETQPREASSNNRLRQMLGRHYGKLVFAEFVAVFVFGVFVAWFLWGGSALSSSESEVELTPAAAESEGPSLWTCSMHPQIRSPNPGKCPVCAMDLIPVAKTSGGMRTLTVGPDARALMSIETVPVERRYVTNTIPMVGKVDYDETKLGYITAWVSGRLDQLYVDFTGVEVNKGDHMVYIYSEELYAAQDELIQALKYETQRPASANQLRVGTIDMVESAREKLRLLGLTEEQVKEIAARQVPTARVTIFSPVSGVVIEKMRQEGERVRLGDRIYTIADLRQVWVHLDAYESDLPWIRYGQEVTITTEAYPGEQFHGRIAFIQPVLNDKTRTVKVRVNVPNEHGKLKPQMFVHAIVRPKVAAGGKVMDPELAGKWISPMHPEIVKDAPGKCDICGMPLVRAESLGYVTPATDSQQPPLVIPRLAALITGTRAVVYVELPVIHSAAEPAFQTLSAVIDAGDLDAIRDAFATYARMLDRPYDQSGTQYARQLWGQYADRLSQQALAGQRAQNANEVEEHFTAIETVMNEAREQFAPQGQPTFEGREIVLGPRAGDYFLVRHGLQEGEMVVTQGNFKIDSEIQIQAKPSMMTPEGGGGGGDGDKTVFPGAFYDQIRDLEAAYKAVTKSIEHGKLNEITAAFRGYSQTLDAVDVSLLTGKPRIFWQEISMLLGNDGVEGSDVTQLAEADRVYLLLKSRMRRMRDQLGVAQVPQREVDRIAVGPEFQAQLAKVWNAYRLIQQALAGDDFGKAQQALNPLNAAIVSIDAGTLEQSAQQVWHQEHANLEKLFASMQAAKDLNGFRTEFKPFSDEIGVLAKAFGFGQAASVYELHCPMAFEGEGANWYQDNDQPQNPYYGASMLQCADRVEQIVNEPVGEAEDLPPIPPPVE